MMMTFKEVFITPVIKKPGLDAADVGSYRPISNLSVISKLLERIVAKQLTDYVRVRRGRKFGILVVGGRAASWWPFYFLLRVRRPYISRTMGRATSQAGGMEISHSGL